MERMAEEKRPRRLLDRRRGGKLDSTGLAGKAWVILARRRDLPSLSSFRPSKPTTVVEDIAVQVGRTGALTPVAHLARFWWQ